MRKTKRCVPIILAVIVGLVLVGRGPGVGKAQTACSTFEETGQEVCYDFLQYWIDHGGLAQQGYPITGRIQERSETDGKTYLVQYFERAVFELHPDNEPPNNVLLSLLGTFRYNDRYPGGAPGQEPNTTSGSVLFKETGKRVGGEYLAYWQQHGGLAQQGLPISDEFQEKSDLDGKTYRVQYFERAVFEYHPENKAPYDVLLSQLGTIRKQEREGATVSFMTDDGLKLSGSLYGKGSTAVILSAQCSRDGKEAWTDFAVRLARNGYVALTYYYRGLGKSQGPGNQTLSSHDLKAAIAFARSQGTKKLVLAGASCGGTISAKAFGAEKPDALIVVSSPPTIPELGIEISSDEMKALAAPKLFVGSEGDQFTAPMLQMYDSSPEPKEKVIYAGNTHGTDLFASEHGKDLTEKLMAFTQEHVPAR
jgi:alpha/beta superfamily hydrolase